MDSHHSAQADSSLRPVEAELGREGGTFVVRPCSKPVDPLAGGGQREAPERSEGGAILVEYGMVLVAVLLVSFALVQAIGSRVVEMVRGVLPGFGG